MSQTMSQPNEYDSIDELDELDELDFNNRKKTEEEETKKTTLLELRKIFHTEMLMMTLHHHNTREKMMRMLNRSKALRKNEWTAEYILQLATDNKIEWVKGSDDPTPYEKYKEEMNRALAKILQPENLAS